MIEGAKALGGSPQRWVRPKLRRSYRQALTIRRAFAWGAENFDDVRIDLWLRSLLDRTRELRPSMRAFYRRLMLRALRAMIADPGPTTDDAKRARRYSTLKRQMGEPSPLLAPVSSAITTEQMIAAYDAARFGAEPATRAHRDEHLILGTFFERLGLPEWIVARLPESQESIIQAFADFAQYPEDGDPQIEDSADAKVQRTKRDVLVNARHIMHVFPWILRHLPEVLAAITPENKERLQEIDKPYALVAKVAKSNPWRLVIFIPMLVWLSSLKDGGWHHARIARTLIPVLQKMIARCQDDTRIAELLNDNNPWTFIVQLNRRTIEEMSGGQAALSVISESAMFRVARLLWPYGLGELHRMSRPQKRRVKLCRSA
ncbi:MAG: hypothetical protein ACREHV_09205 [Rhizomicrobium sp.]